MSPYRKKSSITTYFNDVLCANVCIPCVFYEKRINVGRNPVPKCVNNKWCCCFLPNNRIRNIMVSFFFFCKVLPFILLSPCVFIFYTTEMAAVVFHTVWARRNTVPNENVINKAILYFVTRQQSRPWDKMNRKTFWNESIRKSWSLSSRQMVVVLSYFRIYLFALKKGKSKVFDVFHY